MKRIIFVFLLSAIVFTVAQSQVAFGVKGGFTISDMNMDVTPDTVMDQINGYHAGVYFRFGDELFSFQPEIIFVRKGTNINDENGDWYQKFNMNYIDVPLLLRISVDLKRTELYFNFGPYVGYSIGAKASGRNFDDASGNWVEDTDTYEFDSYIVDRWDAGVVMGAGFRVRMVFFEARFNNGLLNVGQEVYDSSTNKYLNLSLGVQF
ncbi:MAG: porin family protein [Bacteroidota bacterium]